MFPSYESPDDPHTGVRAASTLPLNPLLPSSAPAVTVLHKTKGYRKHVTLCVHSKFQSFPLKTKVCEKLAWFNIDFIWKYEIFSTSNAGSPYRHEILDVPMATKREAVVWPGQFGFQNVSCIKCSNCSKTSIHYLLWLWFCRFCSVLMSCVLSHQKEMLRCCTPSLWRQCAQMPLCVTGIPHCLSGVLTCYATLRKRSGSPHTSYTTQVLYKYISIRRLL